MHVVGLLAVAGLSVGCHVSGLYQVQHGVSVQNTYFVFGTHGDCPSRCRFYYRMVSGQRVRMTRRRWLCSRSGSFAAPSRALAARGCRRHTAGGHRVVPQLGCKFPSPLPPVWPPHGAWHIMSSGFPAEHASTRIPHESRAAASSCVIWSRGAESYCWCRSLRSRLGGETRSKVEKKIGCNHWLPIQANFV